MNEFTRYIAIIKTILDNDYGKERVFYNDGEWYDRNASRRISLDELQKEVMGVVTTSEEAQDYISLLTEKLYEVMGHEDAEKFLESIDS